MDPSMLDLPDGRRIAYRLTEGAGPGVVFLGGFRSDMTGTKAQFLEDRSIACGRAFLRFDYRGHGASPGAFDELGIGDWLADAGDAVARLTQGPQVLVGSSMGGWIALLLAARMPERVAGLVGISAAPDFTEDGIWAAMNAGQRARLAAEGRIALPTEYAEDSYFISRRLVEDGRRHLVLRTPLALPIPVRLLHGSADRDVDVAVALRLFDHLSGPDIRLTLVKDADHRFSAPAALDLLAATVDEVAARSAP